MAIARGELDDLDFEILEALARNGRAKFKEIAKALRVDERKVSRRVDRLLRIGVIKKFAIEIDWSKLGLNTTAYICTRTAVVPNVKDKLVRFFQEEPKILCADSTIGAYEYVIQAVAADPQDLREGIGSPLEPLTAGLSTSIISKSIKPVDQIALLRSVKAKRKGLLK
ncbi:MAG: Lrp/AsnC family transcriptional regulator [Candidatus Bathyarchaeia archaeon]